MTFEDIVVRIAIVMGLAATYCHLHVILEVLR